MPLTREPSLSPVPSNAPLSALHVPHRWGELQAATSLDLCQECRCGAGGPIILLYMKQTRLRGRARHSGGLRTDPSDPEPLLVGCWSKSFDLVRKSSTPNTSHRASHIPIDILIAFCHSLHWSGGITISFETYELPTPSW